MAKYKLKALNILIGGRLFKKEEGVVFDTEKFSKVEIEAAVKAGFLVAIEEPKKETKAPKAEANAGKSEDQKE